MHAHHSAHHPRGLGLLCLLVLLPLGSGAQKDQGAPQDRPAKDTLAQPLPLEIPDGLKVAFAEFTPTVNGSLPLDPGEVALGRALFFDPILSKNRTVSCASCHKPEHSLADNVPFSKGVQGQTTRNTPALINRILGKRHMWDGRAKTLEEQVLLPLASPIEMDLPAPLAAERLAGLPAWTERFQETFGAGPSPDTIARAMAAFVRALVQGNSPVDQFLAGNVAALSPAEEAGMWVFDSRGKCWRCHRGANYSDDELHTTGVGTRNRQPEPGAFAISGESRDLGRFKTPTLRGLAHSAPFMHDGSLRTLEEVVEFYRRGGNPSAALSPLIEPLELTDADATNLVAFLKALTSR